MRQDLNSTPVESLAASKTAFQIDQQTQQPNMSTHQQTQPQVFLAKAQTSALAGGSGEQTSQPPPPHVNVKPENVNIITASSNINPNEDDEEHDDEDDEYVSNHGLQSLRN